LKSVITLTTDFGLTDPYVAAMKGVIISICPFAYIIDITHDVPKFDVRGGAYLLYTATRYFPPGCIHVAIVDPGVGTPRRAIAIKTRKSIYVGPDNGVLSIATQHEGVEKVVEITERKYMMASISSTFHGRDIFAPVAAYLATGTPVEALGVEVNDYVKIAPSNVKVEEGMIKGEVWWIDGFGNIVTNIDNWLADKLKLGDTITVRVNTKQYKALFASTYGNAAPGTLLLIPGSGGLLEIAVNLGNAAKLLNAKVGDTVEIKR